MFGVRKLYEQRIEDLKVEHARMIKLMADEIEYLRAQLVGPKLARQYRHGAPVEESAQQWQAEDFMPPARKSPHYTTEEQEEIQALYDGGHIEAAEYVKAMKAIGVEVTGVDIPDDPHGFFADDDE
jgi:hypothetical protein